MTQEKLAAFRAREERRFRARKTVRRDYRIRAAFGVARRLKHTMPATVSTVRPAWEENPDEYKTERWER